MTEKYLGVETDHFGIKWRVYYARSLERYRRSLRLLSLSTPSWTPSARSTVYSVFIQPQLEYCAVLFALASLDTASPDPRIIAYHDVWESLVAAYEEATCRILGQRSFSQTHYRINWNTRPPHQ